MTPHRPSPRRLFVARALNALRIVITVSLLIGVSNALAADKLTWAPPVLINPEIRTASTSTPGYYANNYLHDDNSAKGTKSVRFSPIIPLNGTYKVYAWWTAASNRASNVPIDVTHAGGTAYLQADQRSNGSQWVLLGIYTFNAGTSGNVLISNTGTNGYVMADGVRFVHVP